MAMQSDNKDMTGMPAGGDLVEVEEGGIPSNREAIAGIPGQEDILVQTGAGQTPLSMVLLTGSEDPKDYLLRGRLTDRQIYALMDATADFNSVYYGDIDLMGLIGLLANASAGKDGAARKEAVQVSGGGAFGALGSSVSRTFGRMRRNYNMGNAPLPQ